MLGNRALQAGVAVVTASGSTTLGFAPGNTTPADLVAVSAASSATIILPVISLSGPALGAAGYPGSYLGAGGNQIYRVQNLAAQTLSVNAGGTDSIVGNTGTVAQNTCRTLVSNPANNTWYAF